MSFERKFSILLFLLIQAAASLAAQNTLCICELNAENFFDTHHQPGHGDEEYVQCGAKRWGTKRYWKKQQDIARVLISMGDNRPPDIIALTEIENDTVVNDLCKRSILRHVKYKYIITQSNDTRGINVALLYQPETFKPISCDTIHIKPTLHTRDILHVAGRLINGDTLHLYVLHLSSRAGGADAMKKREYECKQLIRNIGTLRKISPDAKIIVIGDFNDIPTSKLLTQTLKAQLLTANIHTAQDSLLYNLSPNHIARHAITGTYKYDGKWETIDQCLVSGNLLNKSGKTKTSHSNFHIWAPDFILEHDEEDLKLKPYRTYNYYKYKGGISDHLPIFIDFKLSM